MLRKFVKLFFYLSAYVGQTIGRYEEKPAGP